MVRADCFSGLFGGFDRCGSAAFSDFRGGIPRRRRRRNAFGLIQEYCTTKEIASFGSLPRFARRPVCTEFSGQKRIGDFERIKEKILILNPKTL